LAHVRKGPRARHHDGGCTLRLRGRCPTGADAAVDNLDQVPSNPTLPFVVTGKRGSRYPDDRNYARRSRAFEDLSPRDVQVFHGTPSLSEQIDPALEPGSPAGRHHARLNYVRKSSKFHLLLHAVQRSAEELEPASAVTPFRRVRARE